MRIGNKRKMVCFWALAIGWAGLLFFFSGQTAVESGELSGRIVRWLLDWFGFLPVSMQGMEFLLRKAAHFCIFAVEGLLLALALRHTLPGRKYLPAGMAALGCAGMAVLNELHQLFFDGRSCELRDMLIDFAGGCTGIAAALFLSAAACARCVQCGDGR